MTFEEAQGDMRRAYYDGATGVVTSATAWLAATIAAWLGTPQFAIVVLLVGGMLIFPLSVILSKALGRSGSHARHNPLAPLALSGTFWMILAIPIAYGAALYQVEWFFPAMLLIIGGRYLTFPTLYGRPVYYVLGGFLAAAGMAVALAGMPVVAGAMAGAVIEFVLGGIIFSRARSRAA